MLEIVEISNNTDVINEQLAPQNILNNDSSVDCKLGSTLAIFVHWTIFNDFEQYMKNMCQLNIINQTYDYELIMGQTTYEMKLIYIQFTSEIVYNCVANCLLVGQCRFIFDTEPNLFIAESRYHELQSFIRMHRLEQQIVDINLKPGLIYDACGNSNITVVTFQKFDNWMEVLDKFPNYLRENYTEPSPNYYQTVAFPWLQPSRLKHFRKPIKNPQRTYFIVNQFLTCMRELSYTSEPHANIFDLCNLRLAFCDDREMNEYDADLSYEINSLITRSLIRLQNHTSLFVNNQFNVYQYTNERGIGWNKGIIKHFQYEFQQSFESIIVGISLAGSELAESLISLKHIDVYDHSDLQIVAQKTSTSFELDCSKFEQMDIYTLANMLKYPNVKTIILDTNHKWCNSKPPKYLLIILLILMLLPYKEGNTTLKHIKCFGHNKYKFVEYFVAALKKEFKLWPPLWLFLNSPLKTYDIFNETMFSEITFCDITISLSMLEQIHTAQLVSTKFRLYDCRLENDSKIWDYICKMNNLIVVFILDEQTTWQCFFDFVVRKLEKSKSDGYMLTKSGIFIRNPPISIDLMKYVFVMDSENSKIVIRDKITKDEVDLYYLRNTIYDDKSEYHFYD